MEGKDSGMGIIREIIREIGYWLILVAILVIIALVAASGIPLLGQHSFYRGGEMRPETKSGKITYYIEVPVEISFTRYPALYLGYTAYNIEIDRIIYPTDEQWVKILEDHADRIREACYEEF